MPKSCELTAEMLKSEFHQKWEWCWAGNDIYPEIVLMYDQSALDRKSFCIGAYNTQKEEHSVHCFATAESTIDALRTKYKVDLKDFKK